MRTLVSGLQVGSAARVLWFVSLSVLMATGCSTSNEDADGGSDEALPQVDAGGGDSDEDDDQDESEGQDQSDDSDGPSDQGDGQTEDNDGQDDDSDAQTDDSDGQTDDENSDDAGAEDGQQGEGDDDEGNEDEGDEDEVGDGVGGEDGAWTCDDCPTPPDTTDDWIRGHDETMELLGFDGHVAVYVDDSVDTSKTDWVLPFASDAFAYMKRNYDAECHYGPDRLHVFIHQDDHGGGTISSYFDDFSTFRNAVDTGSGNWERDIANINIDLISHEMAHIVEGSSNCIHESPGFGVWGDSKWAEIFQYDLYKGLGMDEDADKLHERFMNGGDPWYPKFYYPMYRDHGGVKVLDGFFKLLSQYFPTRSENNDRNQTYDRRANLGELVHFYSGAAKADVSDLARDAFGDDFLGDFEKAKRDFPMITY